MELFCMACLQPDILALIISFEVGWNDSATRYFCKFNQFWSWMERFAGGSGSSHSGGGDWKLRHRSRWWWFEEGNNDGMKEKEADEMSGWEGDSKKCFTSQCGGNPEEAMTTARRRRRSRRNVQTGGRATSTRRLLGRWWQGSGMARKVGFQPYSLTLFFTFKIIGNSSLAKVLSSVDLGYMENPCSLDISIYGICVCTITSTSLSFWRWTILTCGEGCSFNTWRLKACLQVLA